MSLQVIARLLLGGIAFGMLGDRFGRLKTLFGSILLYSVANILNAFVTDYHAVDKLLVKQYGEQESDHTVWESAEYQNESLTYLQSDRARPSDIRDYDKNVGLVISLGYLKLYTEWENVLHAMTGANGRVTHQVDVLVRDTKE